MFRSTSVTLNTPLSKLSHLLSPPLLSFPTSSTPCSLPSCPSPCILQDVEIKEEGKRHLLILYNVKKDMAGAVDFSAANAKSNAQLRVKGQSCSSPGPDLV